MKLAALASTIAFPSLACQVDVLGWDLGSDVTLEARASSQETQRLDLRPGERLSLVTDYGDIAVAAAEGTPELRATLTAHGRTPEEARAVLQRYHLKIEHGANGLGASGLGVELIGTPLVVREGSLELQLSAHVDYVATVPIGTSLTATSDTGALSIRGFVGDLRLDTRYGAIEIERARGALHAKSGTGDVHVAYLEGGTAELRSEYGSIHVGEARGTHLVCASGSGDVEVQAAEVDELELTTQYGAVRVGRAGGSVHARSGSGDVRVSGARGALTATSDYGTVEVEGVLTALEARSGSGNVHARALEGSRIESAWRLESSYGSVVLQVPEGFACALDAKTSYGAVACDFPLTMEAGKKAEKRLRGTLGSGGGTVTLSSDSGDVALRKL
jgi:DUF4097 and DUF4098 domain-containing protein YvlB